ncbi:putative acyl-CoA dehydrogenase AidB [compost metagenome]
MLGAAAEMRMALAQALHHARHRRSFGKYLVEHALMANVLADLAIESEAATALSMRVARAVDAAPQEPREAAFARIATAIGKFWICKRTPAFVNEAQECLGGAGYVEESMLPRLYRQAPLNSIWEGSGNVQCLDVLRALAREPQARAALLDELQQANGQSEVYDRALAAVSPALSGDAIAEADARSLVARLAVLLQAATLLRVGSPLAATFVQSRLGGAGHVYGVLDATTPFTDILARALPAD